MSTASTIDETKLAALLGQAVTSSPCACAVITSTPRRDRRAG
jgi:hypothetical protein